MKVIITLKEKTGIGRSFDHEYDLKEVLERRHWDAQRWEVINVAPVQPPPTTEQTELWKEVIEKINWETRHGESIEETGIPQNYFISRNSTRKQEVPEAVEFKDWCEKNESTLCFREQRTLSTAELYAEFQLFKQKP